jgi:hypothetical protein
MQEQFETQIDLPNNELCPQCEADDGDFYNGLAIGEICEECQAFNQAVDEALIEAGDELTESIAWQIGKDRGYSSAALALPEASAIVKARRSI